MKIAVLTLGCKVNKYESESMMLALKEQGHEVFSHLCFADVYIINTCAVTNEAERKSRQMVSRCLALNDKAKVYVCGCASQNNAKQFEKLKNVQAVYGNANKLDIANNLDQKGTHIKDLPNIYEDVYKAYPTQIRAYVKIQDGCNNFCTYCLIPYLRGRSRSRDLNSILKEVDSLKYSVKEIVLTGIDVSDYKIDGEKALDVLVDKLSSYKNIRFRLSSLEQGVVDEKLLVALKKSNFCPHFHLSLQSGCDSVLKRMNRKYKTKDYLSTVKLIRKYFKDANISTDIIVGFKGETKKEFKTTYNFAKKVKFANIHIFPYSVRLGTVAQKQNYFEVDKKTKKAREAKLQSLNAKLHKKYINEFKNKTLTVLVEEKVGEYFVGYSENYIKCYIKSPVKINEFVKVKIKKQFQDGALAITV